MKTLLTGSRAYGTPREDSDIDIVMLAESDEDHLLFQLLRSYSDEQVPSEPCAEGLYAGNLKCGRLNLILVSYPDVFEVWERGTAILEEFAPVTREQAVYVLKGLREGTHTYKQARAYLTPKIGLDP